jgi:hypothetical protein
MITKSRAELLKKNENLPFQLDDSVHREYKCYLIVSYINYALSFFIIFRMPISEHGSLIDS